MIELHVMQIYKDFSITVPLYKVGWQNLLRVLFNMERERESLSYVIMYELEQSSYHSLVFLLLLFIMRTVHRMNWCARTRIRNEVEKRKGGGDKKVERGNRYDDGLQGPCRLCPVLLLCGCGIRLESAR